jgi:hypothetical protein
MSNELKSAIFLIFLQHSPSFFPVAHHERAVDSLPSFGDTSYTKSARRPRQVPGQFTNRLGVIHKNVSDWFYKIECDVTSLYKNIVKNTKT